MGGVEGGGEGGGGEGGGEGGGGEGGGEGGGGEGGGEGGWGGTDTRDCVKVTISVFEPALAEGRPAVRPEPFHPMRA